MNVEQPMQSAFAPEVIGRRQRITLTEFGSVGAGSGQPRTTALGQEQSVSMITRQTASRWTRSVRAYAQRQTMPEPIIHHPVSRPAAEPSAAATRQI